MKLKILNRDFKRNFDEYFKYNLFLDKLTKEVNFQYLYYYNKFGIIKRNYVYNYILDNFWIFK